MQVHLQAVFYTVPRITAASLFTFILAQQLDIYLFGNIRRLLPQWPVLSSCISVAISQLFDTVLFTYSALWGLVQNPLDIIVVSFTIKIVALMGATSYLYIAKLFIPKPSPLL
jgi:uncharacterized integral membrane protein (TIGR00697 family)